MADETKSDAAHIYTAQRSMLMVMPHYRNVEACLERLTYAELIAITRVLSAEQGEQFRQRFLDVLDDSDDSRYETLIQDTKDFIRSKINE